TVLVLSVLTSIWWFGQRLGQWQAQHTSFQQSPIAQAPLSRQTTRSTSFTQKLQLRPPAKTASAQQHDAFSAKMRKYEATLLQRMRRQDTLPPPPPLRQRMRVRAIQRSALRSWANLPLRQSGARYVPHFVWGRPKGMKITQLTRGSFLDTIGLREGDILLNVGNTTVMSPGQAQKVYQKTARQYRGLHLRYLRNGHEHTLDLSLRKDS
ncbi:MAG: hypothetical protein AAGJ35_05085, partial [Myxococcota bacterium]